MSSEENDLFPKIIVDTTADGYAEIDEEVEEEPMDEEIPPEDEKPDIPKVEKNVLRNSAKAVRKRKFFRCPKRSLSRPLRKNPRSLLKHLSPAVRGKRSPRRNWTTWLKHV